MRSSDIPARYGGDEFGIILPDTDRNAAELVARKLARAVATGRNYAGPLSTSLPISASYGVATCPEEARTVAELLQLADDRLYASKDGRLLLGNHIVPRDAPPASPATQVLSSR